MEPDVFDLAGFCVGAVDEADLLGPHRVHDGDVLIGLPSSGLHANGYSLVRSALLPSHDLEAVAPELGRSLVDELLEPCAVHAPAVVALSRDGLIHAAAHVTGGGIRENLPRVLPPGLGARVQRGTWPEHHIFGLLQRVAGVTDADMFATFNMGIGMVLVIDQDRADDVLQRTGAFRIGEVVSNKGVRID
jgi:phosphoribosylformylglycinamidine cyclo-ligase